MTVGVWLPAALFAGLFQAWRTALQQRLRGELSVSGAGLVRYLFGAPLALTMAAAYLFASRRAPPPMDAPYLGLAAAAGVAQILGTALLVMSFGHRGFVAGTAFSKTEALMAAVAAAAFLSERLPWLAWTGIAAGVAGVMLLSLPPRSSSLSGVFSGMLQPAALCGLGAAALFAITGLCVREATGLLPDIDPIAAALVTLSVVMIIQTVLHGTWVSLREPTTWRAVWTSRRSSALVGLLAACGSACWFTGFATAPVALVRVVGQVEVAFTLAFAHIYLGEPTRAREAASLLLIAAGVVLVLMAAWR